MKKELVIPECLFVFTPKRILDGYEHYSHLHCYREVQAILKRGKSEYVVYSTDILYSDEGIWEKSDSRGLRIVTTKSFIRWAKSRRVGLTTMAKLVETIPPYLFPLQDFSEGIGLN